MQQRLQLASAPQQLPQRISASAQLPQLASASCANDDLLACKSQGGEIADTQLGFESCMAQLEQLAAQQHACATVAHKFASTAAQQLAHIAAAFKQFQFAAQ